MQAETLYVSSFVLPDYENLEILPSSHFHMGPEGIFGFSICLDPYSDGDKNRDVPCYLLICDIHRQHVDEYYKPVSYLTCYDLHIGYDHNNNVWIAVVSGADMTLFEKPDRARSTTSDFYEIDAADYTSWQRITSFQTFLIDIIDDIYGPMQMIEDDGKFVHAFWQQKESFPLIMVGSTSDFLTPDVIYLTQWRSREPNNRYTLGCGFRWETYRFDDALVLCTCYCPEEMLQWQIEVSAFDLQGNQFAETILPNVSFPSQREKYWVADDLGDWLHPIIQIIPGPLHGPTQIPTCVAALQLRDQPEKTWLKQSRYVENGLPKSQGGLYCIDRAGQIVQQELSPLGDDLSMCLCGENVVGADRIDGTWRLWFWSPRNEPKTVVPQTFLAQDTLRIKLVPIDAYDQHARPYFWCVEESAADLRVSLWDAHRFQVIHHSRVKGIKLPLKRMESRIHEPHTIAAYHDKLLILGIDRERHLQLLQFQ